MSKNFFINNLNYSYANEDSTVEQLIAKELHSESILSVCGSGSRIIPLVNGISKKIDIIDLSQTQLSWAKLYVESSKKLDFQDYKSFWGIEDINHVLRKQKFEHFVSSVDERLIHIFKDNNWHPPMYYGGWEKTYQKLSKIVQFFLGTKNLEKLTASNNMSDQWDIFKSFGFQLRWKLVLFIVGNRALFNSFLYKGHFIKKNLPISYVRFYVEAFERLFRLSHIKYSFFLQFSFLGKLIYQQGGIVAGLDETLKLFKAHICKTQINFLQEDIMISLKQMKNKYDLIILSDVPSYFSNDLGEKFLQDISPSLNEQGVVIVRYYLREYQPSTEGYLDITSTFQEIIDNERVQMYSIKVYQKN